MSLITEDGTGLANAESYISVDDCTTYLNNVGATIWQTISLAEQEQALRRATSYLVGFYRLKWKGRRVIITQALDWPRVGVVLEDFGGSQGRQGMGSYGLFQVPFNIVPVEVKNACAELALRATMGPLADDLTQNALSETVGPVTVKYDPYSPQRVRYPQIHNAIRVYLLQSSSSSTVNLIRT